MLEVELPSAWAGTGLCSAGSALEIRLQKALGQSLDCLRGMRFFPALLGAVVLQPAVRNGKVFGFEYELEDNSVRRLFADREAHRIGMPFLRQPRTAERVAEIARFKLVGGKLRAFLTRHSTFAVPRRTQRQTRRMWQSQVFHLLARRKERAGHDVCSPDST